MSWDPKRMGPLSDSFILDGYYEPKGSFVCSIDAPGYPTIEVNDDIINQWDPLWKQANEEFEQEIADTCWKDLSGKMFYTWDGNHRLTSWMAAIKTCMFFCFQFSYIL